WTSVPGVAAHAAGASNRSSENRDPLLLSAYALCVPPRVTATICVFARPPVPGRTKTRLIPKLGADAAADLASAMLQDVWRTAGKLGVSRVLATTELGSFPIAVNPDQIWRQPEGDLGFRIEEILRR